MCSPGSCLSCAIKLLVYWCWVTPYNVRIPKSEDSQMSTHMSAFLPFSRCFASFLLVKLVTSSIRVNTIYSRLSWDNDKLLQVYGTNVNGIMKGYDLRNDILQMNPWTGFILSGMKCIVLVGIMTNCYHLQIITNMCHKWDNERLQTKGTTFCKWNLELVYAICHEIYCFSWS